MTMTFILLHEHNETDTCSSILIMNVLFYRPSTQFTKLLPEGMNIIFHKVRNTVDNIGCKPESYLEPR